MDAATVLTISDHWVRCSASRHVVEKRDCR